MKDFKQFITEEKEMKVGDYQTTHHYMCPSAIRFLKKRQESQADAEKLLTKTKLQNIDAKALAEDLGYKA